MLQIPEKQHTPFLHKNYKITKYIGLPTTCVDSRLPYHYAGTDKLTRKGAGAADMMTLTGCRVIPNAQRNFSADTRLNLDVPIGFCLDPSSFQTNDITESSKL